MQKLILTFFLSVFIFSCSIKTHTLMVRYENSPMPDKPDYSKIESWAALPTKVDAADSTPRKSNVTNNQVSAKADVFFVYPTIFTDAPKNEYQWNADVNDAALNNDIQQSTLLNQATAFNGACRVFAPYYRQAHLFAFYTPNPEDGKQALDLAYQDVKTAFEYYLEHYNQGRPIVIASHSQGSYHCERLLQDYFDGKELQKKLVAAYLIGRAISPQAFQHISPTKTPDEIGVWASWNTFARNYIPTNYQRYQNALSTNPLLWNASEEYVSKELNKGGVALKFTYAPHLVDAQNHQGLLWVSRPNIKGSWLFKHKVWHRADINFFYMNIRENVALRVDRFLEVNSSERTIGK